MAKTIEDYKRDYAEAAARGDAAGMKAANDGANAIRRSEGIAEEKATSDINKVASGGTSGMVSNPGRYDDGGYSSGRSSRDDDDDWYAGSSTSSASGSTGSGYKPYVQGQNAALERELAVWSQRYNEAKERALAGDMSAVMDMRNANDEANKLRNAYGYAAVFANEDINNVKKQINYYGGGASSGGASSGGASSGGASSGGSSGGGSVSAAVESGWNSGGAVEDLSEYLEELYAAQRRQTLANLNNAYQQNVNAINRAGEGVDARYQNARNQAAGASELAARNFAEYAAASGLNSGAGGQAELARNVTLQNNLNDINTAEAEVYADLELQLSNAETEYNNAIAQAEASNDFALAESLYQEKVRVQQELVNQQMQQYQMDLQNRQLAFQQQQAEIANQQWQQQFDYGVEQDRKSALAAAGAGLLNQGIMPGAEQLEAMGLSTEEAQAYINNLSILNSFSAAGLGGGSDGSSGGGYDNGSRTTGEIMRMQEALGVTPDGYWGPATRAAANGLSADEAWESMNNGYNEAYFRAAMNSLSAMLAQGKVEQAVSGLNSLWVKLSEAQRLEVQDLLGGYGYAYQGG